MTTRTQASAPDYPSSEHYHADEFTLPRLHSDEDIEALFSDVLETLSPAQKWDIIYAVKKISWQEENARREQARRHPDPIPPHHSSPEWYIRRFTDGTITVSQASSVWTSLRGHEPRWLDEFVDLKGAVVLARSLAQISRKPQRTQDDISLELEAAKCLKVIFGSTARVRDAMKYPNVVPQIISSLNAPHLQTRRTIMELLLSILDCSRHFLEHIFQGLAALSHANCNSTGYYTYWFQSLEATLRGRGRMGSLVGASEEIRRTGGKDTALTEYALVNIKVIVRIFDAIAELDTRDYHHKLMNAAGLQNIVALCRNLDIRDVDRQLDQLEMMFDEDRQSLRERYDPRKYANPEKTRNAPPARADGFCAERPVRRMSGRS
ncbi:hypothetical protein HYDPIDRAFT_106178 [Hydnomerulius pinastri MD-312]|nr:hypothetical protein HYDPIDRAFT_106178 [Hydnomerulius pinastri MD-312]